MLMIGTSITSTARRSFFYVFPLGCFLLCNLPMVASFSTSSYARQFLETTTSPRCRLHTTALGGRSIDVDEDYYFALNITRYALPDEIRDAYRSFSRKFHPDLFSEELRFDPNVMSSSELRAFLVEEKVGLQGGIVERQELVKLSIETHRRSGNVGAALQKKRDEVTARFTTINMAYNTLKDKTSRRRYNLSGDWGIRGVSGKTRDDKKGMGDRDEAERVRRRAEAVGRDPIQQKVYEDYMKEKADKAAAEAKLRKEREMNTWKAKAERRRAKEEEERRRKKQRSEMRSVEFEMNSQPAGFDKVGQDLTGDDSYFPLTPPTSTGSTNLRENEMAEFDAQNNLDALLRKLSERS